MKYLAWDIGIKNLAYNICEYNIEDNSYKILYWEVINLVEDTSNKKISNNHLCSKIMKKKNGESICNKKATFYNIEDACKYCKTHSKSIKNKNSILEISKIGCSHIMTNGNNKGVKCNKKITFNTNKEFIGYCSIHAKKYDNCIKIIKKKKDTRNELEKISLKLIEELDKRDYLLDVDCITIENQPAMKNPKMKSIQMIIYTYFLLRGRVYLEKDNLRIMFLLATNKLKVDFDLSTKNEITNEINNKHKDKYKRRKECAMKYAEYFIKEDLYQIDNMWLDIFTSHKKKDDLADTFLMNVYQSQIDNKNS